MDLSALNKAGLKEKLFKRGFALTYTLRGLEHRHFLGDAILGDASKVTLGRSLKCDIHIPCQGVAPFQCRFERTSTGELLLFSESDEVPVYVNGFPVEFKSLSPGDEIRIASLRLKISNPVAIRAVGGFEESSVRYEGEFSRAFSQAIKKSHWLAVSVFIHIALILFLFNIEREGKRLDGSVGFVQEPVASACDPADLLEDAPANDLETLLDELTPPEPLPSEFDTGSESVEAVLSRIPVDSQEYFPGSAGARGPAGVGSGLLRRKTGGGAGGDASGGGGWQKHMVGLRDKGMDLAIRFEATGSRGGFSQDGKDTSEEMVRGLEWIVRDLNMSLVTYKGDLRSSSYVVAHTPLVRDPYELLNFMRSVRISGGSRDGFAAILTALDISVNALNWRSGTEKAIIIIGDAPPFTKEVKSCITAARKFRTQGKVGTIYKESGSVTLMFEPETIGIFKRISGAGGGPFLRHDQSGDVARRIVSAVLGTEWEENIDAAFQRKRSPQWLKVIRRKQKEEDFDWLFDRFRRRGVRPELVDALVEMGGIRVAREMWRCLLRHKDTPTWLLQRALYVLQEMADIEIDYMEVERARLDNGQMAYIAEALRYAYGPEVLTGEDDSAD